MKLWAQKVRADSRGGGGACLIETDIFRMMMNGLGRLASRREAGFIVKITKSFHSLALINAGRQSRDIIWDIIMVHWGKKTVHMHRM